MTSIRTFVSTSVPGSGGVSLGWLSGESEQFVSAHAAPSRSRSQAPNDLRAAAAVQSFLDLDPTPTDPEAQLRARHDPEGLANLERIVT